MRQIFCILLLLVQLCLDFVKFVASSWFLGLKSGFNSNKKHVEDGIKNQCISETFSGQVVQEHFGYLVDVRGFVEQIADSTDLAQVLICAVVQSLFSLWREKDCALLLKELCKEGVWLVG